MPARARRRPRQARTRPLLPRPRRVRRRCRARTPPEPLPDALLLTLPGSTAVAAHATARAAGLTVLQVPGGDPRADEQVVDALAAAAPTTVLALGAPFGDQATAGARVAAAATGVQLPGGGQLVFPTARTPGATSRSTAPRAPRRSACSASRTCPPTLARAQRARRAVPTR